MPSLLGACQDTFIHSHILARPRWFSLGHERALDILKVAGTRAEPIRAEDVLIARERFNELDRRIVSIQPADHTCEYVPIWVVSGRFGRYGASVYLGLYPSLVSSKQPQSLAATS